MACVGRCVPRRAQPTAAGRRPPLSRGAGGGRHDPQWAGAEPRPPAPWRWGEVRWRDFASPPPRGRGETRGGRRPPCRPSAVGIGQPPRGKGLWPGAAAARPHPSGQTLYVHPPLLRRGPDQGRAGWIRAGYRGRQPCADTATDTRCRWGSACFHHGGGGGAFSAAPPRVPRGTHSPHSPPPPLLGPQACNPSGTRPGHQPITHTRRLPLADCSPRLLLRGGLGHAPGAFAPAAPPHPLICANATWHTRSSQAIHLEPARSYRRRWSAAAGGVCACPTREGSAAAAAHPLPPQVVQAPRRTCRLTGPRHRGGRGGAGSPPPRTLR